jgi:hypothetical protein
MLREALPPGASREQMIATIREHFEALVPRLDSAVEDLRELVAAHEPVQLISSVAIPTGMRLMASGDSLADATDTVSWPAKIEYLVGVALSVPAGSGPTPTAITQRVMDLVSDVFDAAYAKEMLASFDRQPTGNAALDEAVFMLRMEHLVDRMPGYAAHLERIDAEIFDRHRDAYLDALGFNPGDVVRVVRRHNAAQQRRGAAAMTAMQKMADRDVEAAARATVEFFASLTDSRTWRPSEVGAVTDIDPDEIRRMLDFFATTFGSQPQFRLPTDSNLARTHPVIRLDSDAYFIPDTWTLAAAVHPCLAQAAREQNGVRRYRDHREQGHQRLVATALREVFPPEIVHESQHYEDEILGPGEVDALVSAEWPLIVEAKAHGLTEPGRRGAPSRVERVAGDVVAKALQQTERATKYVIERRRREFHAQGALSRPILPETITGTTEIVVTFERFDPIAMLGLAVVNHEPRPVWIVGLADLLMVCEVLDHPTEFHHYCRTRADTSVTGPAVYVESDAVGGYLVNRLRIPRQDDQMVILGYSSDSVNAYFTGKELGHEATRPRTGVPSDVLAALDMLLQVNTGLWVRAADAVMHTQSDSWRRWRKYRRRHDGRGQFSLTSQLQLVGGSAPSLTVEGDVLHLCLSDSS